MNSEMRLKELGVRATGGFERRRVRPRGWVTLSWRIYLTLLMCVLIIAIMILGLQNGLVFFAMSGANILEKGLKFLEELAQRAKTVLELVEFLGIHKKSVCRYLVTKGGGLWL